MRLRFDLVAGFVLLGVVAAGCGAGGRDDPSIPTRGGSAPSSPGGHCSSDAGFTGNVNDQGSVQASGRKIELTARDSFFDPTCTTDVASGTVTVDVSNKGSAVHNLSVPDQGIDQDIEAGKSVTVHINVAASAVRFFCKYHRTSGMVGALIPSGK